MQEKFMRHVVIPDIHEKIDRLDYVVGTFDTAETHFVLLGDYFDSFTHHISEVRRLCTWLNSAALQPDKYTLLLGNHDIQYLLGRKHRCSGYQSDTAATIEMMLTPETRKAFRYQAWIADDILCSHAGLSQTWVDNAFGIGDAPAYPSAAEIRAWLEACEALMINSPHSGKQIRKISPYDLYTAVGRARGGEWSSVGGLTWCDWDREFTPVPALRQIIGHTNENAPRTNGENWCIDTELEYVAVVEEDAQVRIESVIR